MSLSQCWLSEQPCLPGMGLPQYPWEAWPRANVAMAVRAAAVVGVWQGALTWPPADGSVVGLSLEYKEPEVWE